MVLGKDVGIVDGANDGDTDDATARVDDSNDVSNTGMSVGIIGCLVGYAVCTTLISRIR